MPAVDATIVIGWCGLKRRAHRRGAGAMAVERKVGGRHGREGGMRGGSDRRADA
jgi:hypothetical protein